MLASSSSPSCLPSRRPPSRPLIGSWHPGTGPTFKTTGKELVAFDGYVYFAANDDVTGNELWRTDGTTAGTTLVRDFNVGNAVVKQQSAQLHGGRQPPVLHRLQRRQPRSAIFTIDPGGTPQATTVGGGAPLGGGTLMGAVDGKALLSHYDGSTYTLYALGQTGSVFSADHHRRRQRRRRRVRDHGRLGLLRPDHGPNGATEPWRTNGRTSQKVKEIVPGVDGSGPRDFIATGNRVYFRADDGFHGRELWVTDGTDAGTQLVHEHHPLGRRTRRSRAWAANGNVLYYVPDDPTTGGEVWRTDGTEAGDAGGQGHHPGTGRQRPDPAVRVRQRRRDAARRRRLGVRRDGRGHDAAQQRRRRRIRPRLPARGRHRGSTSVAGSGPTAASSGARTAPPRARSP